MNVMASRNCLSIINLIKEKYIFCQTSCVSCKNIIEAIKRNSFRELSDTNHFVVVISLNPTTK